MIFQPKGSKSTSLVASCELSTTSFEGAVEEPFQVVFHLARKLRSCQGKNSTMVARCIKISRFGEKQGTWDLKDAKLMQRLLMATRNPAETPVELGS